MSTFGLRVFVLGHFSSGFGFSYHFILCLCACFLSLRDDLIVFLVIFKLSVVMLCFLTELCDFETKYLNTKALGPLASLVPGLVPGHYNATAWMLITSEFYGYLIIIVSLYMALNNSNYCCVLRTKWHKSNQTAKNKDEYMYTYTYMHICQIKINQKHFKHNLKEDTDSASLRLSGMLFYSRDALTDSTVQHLRNSRRFLPQKLMWTDKEDVTQTCNLGPCHTF